MCTQIKKPKIKLSEGPLKRLKTAYYSVSYHAPLEQRQGLEKALKYHFSTLSAFSLVRKKKRCHIQIQWPKISFKNTEFLLAREIFPQDISRFVKILTRRRFLQVF